ncbi:MAG: RNA-guided pseudouridylation complex pseudouridine synthase subunit Cbf5 [Candidatus Asgardarchaeia archaeon]
MKHCPLPSDKARTMLIRASDTTDPKYGKKPEERSVEELIKKGVINLDKPSGPTSHEVVAWVKRILGLSKAGHSGTLDPGVTGVLPVALENATRILSALLISGKEYVGILHLHSEVPEHQIRQAFKLFIGPIYQRPPLKSSVKRTLRIRHIYCLDILEIDGKDVLFRVACQAGTYIRKLCHDIGLVLGVGAHMSELRRIRSGPFSENEHLVTLHELAEAYYLWKHAKEESYIRKVILPMEYALQHLPKVIIRDSAVDAICHGADLAAPGVLQVSSGIQPNDLIVIYTLKGEAVALARAKMSSMQILKANKGIVADTERVLMERGTYPPWYYYKNYSSNDESSTNK